MAYKKVQSLDCDKVFALGGVNSTTGKPNPTFIEGYYLGVRTVKSEDGESKIHVFQTPGGQEGIWGSADTNAKLGNCVIGRKTLVEFVAKKKISGGKTKKIYDVAQDEKFNIEVEGLVADSGSTDSSEETEDDAGSDDVDGNSDETYEEDDTVVASSAAQREANRSKVNEILNRGKRKQA